MQKKSPLISYTFQTNLLHFVFLFSFSIYAGFWRNGFEHLVCKVIAVSCSTNAETISKWYNNRSYIICPEGTIRIAKMAVDENCSYAIPIIKIENGEDLGNKILTERNRMHGISMIGIKMVKATLVGGHGLFVFGNTVDETYRLLAAIEELFEVMVKAIEKP